MGQIVMGTAGHIDHGKTALVKALTGMNTDRLAEEKARGMTIDLGFAFLNENVTIIDVPGHEKFIRNMVAGVSTIHIALLVVAADDGIMPQTREHLHILNLLGIHHGLIAMTKTDLVTDTDWLDLIELDIRELVKDSFLADAPIIKTSAESGLGIEEIKQAIIHEANRVSAIADRGFFRLAVDRVFSKTGFGTVVTGTVSSGEISPGEEVELVPTMVKGKIRGLQTHGTKTSKVKLGDRAALNLSGIDKTHIRRGTELATKGWLTPTKRIIANVSLIPDTKWVLKNKQRVHLHIGTAEELATVIIPSKKPLKAGRSCPVIFDLESPVSAAMDDRFIIRSYSPMETLGGCTVLGVNPQQQGKALLKWAADLTTEPTERFNQYVLEYASEPKSVFEWSKVFHCSTEWIHHALNSSKLRNEKSIVFSPVALKGTMEWIQTFFKDFHKKNPYIESIPFDRLLAESQFSEVWLQVVLDDLIKNDIVIKTNGEYALTSHRVVLSGEDAEASDRIKHYLIEYGMGLSSTEEIATGTACSSKKALELLHILKNRREAIEAAQGWWVHIDSLKKLTNLLSKYFEKTETMTVGEFKGMTGTTRKTAIPLLEYFDKKNLTTREGNLRTKGENL